MAWLYVFYIIGLNLAGFVTGYLALSSIDTSASADLAREVGDSLLMHIAYSTRTTLLALLESALIVWALTRFSSDVVRDEFADQ